jgi:hypothetical protein
VIDAVNPNFYIDVFANSNFTYQNVRCALFQRQSVNSCFHLTVHNITISLGHCVKVGSAMRLRTRIQAPERFEDEDYDTVAASNATKPAFPRLLKEQTVSFDPHLPSAAFPSLTQAHPQEHEDRMIKDLSELADVEVMDIDRSLDHIFLPLIRRGGQLDTQNASTTLSSSMQDPPVFGRSFLDDAETSDDEEHEVSFQGFR